MFINPYMHNAPRSLNFKNLVAFAGQGKVWLDILRSYTLKGGSDQVGLIIQCIEDNLI